MHSTTPKHWLLTVTAALLMAAAGCAPSSTASGSNEGGGGSGVSGGEGTSSVPFTLTGSHSGSVGSGGTSYYFANQTGNPLRAETTNNSANIQVRMFDGSFGGTKVCDNTTKNPNDIMDCDGTISTSAYILVDDAGGGGTFDIDVFAP